MGAYRAAQLGATAGQILGFYYSTSTAGSFADRTMRVQLSATEGDRLVGVRNQAGLVATVYAADQRTVLGTRGLTDHTGWRVVTDAAGLKVQWQDGTVWTDVTIGGRTAFADGALVDVRATGVLPLFDEDGGSRTYRGSYRVSRLNSLRIRAVNHVPIESGYLPRWCRPRAPRRGRPPRCRRRPSRPDPMRPGMSSIRSRVTTTCATRPPARSTPECRPRTAGPQRRCG